MESVSTNATVFDNIRSRLHGSSLPQGRIPDPGQTFTKPLPVAPSDLFAGLTMPIEEA